MALVLLLGLAVPGQAQDTAHLVFVPGACMIADTTFHATAGVPPFRVMCPAIVYNPLKLYRLPPPVAVYVMEHEAAHIGFHGEKPAMPAACAEPGHPLCQQWRDEVRNVELDADCRAGAALAAKWPTLYEQVVLWFERIAPRDTTSGHGDRTSVRQTIEALKRCGGTP